MTAQLVFENGGTRRGALLEDFAPVPEEIA
jgi:hypothetical protein